MTSTEPARIGRARPRGEAEHRALVVLDDRVPGWVRDAHAALRRLAADAHDPQAIATLDGIVAAFEVAATAFVEAALPERAADGPAEARAAEVDRRLAEAAREIARLSGEAQRRAAEAAELRSRLAAAEAERAVIAERDRELRALIDEARSGPWWRRPAPLRAAQVLAGLPLPDRAPAPPVEAPPPVAPAATPLPSAEPERAPLPGFDDLSEADRTRLRAAFDAAFYLASHPDVLAANVDPLEHYLRFGWKEGRDPSPAFSTRYYLDRAPDLRDAGLCPFVHWIAHGQRERRPTLPRARRLARLDPDLRVEAIVPNYNHARYLGQRLDSILAQTYPNVRILILDDGSSDDSRAVIDAYCARHPDRIRAILNERNSGNVFRQWRKGVENSDGDLVWICESDDYCEPDFLERLVPAFADRATTLAFGRIQFCDAEGRFREGLDQYREGAEPGIWGEPLVRPARQWFANGFGVNNLVANVSGCLWRRQSLPEAVWEEAQGYTVLGDWFLYCHLAGGGLVAYEPAAVTYFRQHGGNTSVGAFRTPAYYAEHERLMLLLRRQWDVPDATVERFHAQVAGQYAHHDLAGALGPLGRHLDKAKLLAERRSRPHVLMAILGFHPGGGEVFPIHLANALHARGHLVSVMALDVADANPEMLAALDPGIPVYDSDYVWEVGVDRFLAEAGVSLIHSHMISLEAFFLEMSGMETRVPYVVSLHGSYEGSGLGEERLMRFARFVRHWVYTADKNLEPFRPLLPILDKANFTKLPNAMPRDPRPFPRSRAELGIAEDAVVFSLVARGIPRKGWRAATAAFARLRAAHPQRPVHLLLCGEGEEVDRQRARHAGDAGIGFLGYQSCINGLYRLSDCAIVPTRFEGESYPLCIIQALQEGTPVISTRVGEIAAMVAPPGTDSGGLLLDPVRDTEAFTASLAEAMAAMLDPERRMRLAAGARALGAGYSIERLADAYAALYGRVLAS